MTIQILMSVDVDSVAARLTAFDLAMAPFVITEEAGPPQRWRLTTASWATMHSYLADGLFTYDIGQALWFEDLTLYRNGQEILSMVSHERLGFLTVNEGERRILEAAGLIVTQFDPRVWTTDENA